MLAAGARYYYCFEDSEESVSFTAINLSNHDVSSG
jgi:hypothetical protein